MKNTHVSVTILKWEKYQKRKDIQSPWWFAVSNELWRSAEFSMFTSDEKVVWYALLALASKSKAATICFSVPWFASNCHVSVTAVMGCFVKIEQNQWATVICTGSVRDPGPTRHDMTLQDMTGQEIYKRSSVELSKLSSPVTPFSPIKQGLLENLSPEAQNKLTKLYPEADFVDREVEKMGIWLASNSHRTPRSKAGWTRFVMGWLERGWERHRKSIPSTRPGDINWSKVFEGDKDG